MAELFPDRHRHLIKGICITEPLALPAGCKKGFAEVVRSEPGGEGYLGVCQTEKMEKAFQVENMFKCTV